MEKPNKEASGSASSSFIVDLFGPKDNSKSSSSSSGLFSSVFGPSSTGLGRDSTHSGLMGSHNKTQDYGKYYGNAKHATSEYGANRSRGEYSGANRYEKSSNYQSETVGSRYFSSSIYYGAQDVYSSTNESTPSHHVFKKDERDDDPGGNHFASRGNWWQGSLYY